MSWKAEKAVDAEGIVNCLGHSKEAAFRTSRTAANPDRDFYACDQKPSCNFFIWADDPHLIRVMNARAGGVPSSAPSAQLQTIGRPPSSSLPNAAHSTPTKNAKSSSSSLPTPPKSANRMNSRPREPSPDWPSDVEEEEEEERSWRREKKKQSLVEEDDIIDDAQWDTDGEQVLQAGREEERGGRFKFRGAKGKKRARAEEEDSDDEGSDYEATQKEKRRKAIGENMARMRAERNLPPSTSKSTTTLQTPPISPSKSTPNLADKKTIDFLRAKNAKLRDEKAALAEEVKRLEGEYAETVDEVIGLKAKESDWEEERETWLRRLEVLEGGRRVAR